MERRIAAYVYGERVRVCIVPKGDRVTLERVATYMRQREMVEFLIPERRAEFCDFPLNSGGKVSKADLRLMVIERMSDFSDPGRQAINAREHRCETCSI
jgi:non-ribosomal peptide synthetase component E (peptide arylation enzyme)